MTENKGDLISREALKEKIENLIGYSLSYEAILNAIDNASTVELATNLQLTCNNLQQRQGEWINDSDNLPICNKCGEIALQRIFVKMPHLIQDVRMVRSNFCPNCGAKMKGGEEE